MSKIRGQKSPKSRGLVNLYCFSCAFKFSFHFEENQMGGFLENASQKEILQEKQPGPLSARITC